MSGVRSGRLATVVLGIGGWLALGLAVAPPAAASHVIEWGAGTECASVQREAAATVNEQVPFIVCASIGDEPLAGWEMTLQVVGPTRSVEASIVAGDNGIARFAVQPTAAGTTTVTLCDPDGCVYGQTVLVVSEPAPAPTTTAPPVPPAPASTTNVAAAPTTTSPAPVVETTATTVSPGPATDEVGEDRIVASGPTTATTGIQERATTTIRSSSRSETTASSSASSGFSLLWAFVALVLLLFLAATWRGMLAMPIGNPPIDPCAELRRRVAELSGLLADAIIRATETQKRRDEVRAATQRVHDADAASGPAFDDLESEQVMADAMDEQADAEVRGLRAELDAATAALRRCEGGEAPPPETGAAGGTGEGPQPGSTPPPEQPPPCCHRGQWIGFSVACGGIVGPYGTDGGYIFLFCVGDLERKAIISFAGRRIGLGLGGATQAGIFFIVRGPQHPSELQPAVERILAGVDFDVSVGASVTKLGEAALTGVRKADDVAELVQGVRTYMTQCRALKQARRRGDIEDAVAIQREFGEVLQRFGETNRLEDVVDKMVEATGKGGMSAGQAGASGANVPLGIGLQVGVWNVDRVQTELVHVFGCAACSPGNH